MAPDRPIYGRAMSSATLIAAPRRDADRDGVVDGNVGRPEAPGTRPRSHVRTVSLFPAVRPFSGAASVSARRRRSLSDGSVTAGWVLEEGLKRLDRGRRIAILERWLRPDPGSAAPLVVDNGCDVRIGGTIAREPLRSALLRWLPCSTTDLALFEDGLFTEAPADALALLLRPPTIWAAEEAATAERRFPRGRAAERERFAAIERYGRSRVEVSHRSRLLEAVERIIATLPVAGFPLAHSIVVAGCRLVSDDPDRCAATAARQLARYATSVRTSSAA